MGGAFLIRTHLKTLPQLLKSLRLYNSRGKGLKESELVSFGRAKKKKRHAVAR